jgi:acetyltransferase
VRTLEEAGIPCYAFPEPAVKTLAGMARLGERRLAPPSPFVPSVDPAGARAWLAEQGATPARQLGMPELAPLLAAYGIRCVDGRLAKSADDAAAVADRLGYPVAMKIVSPDISHKSEVGGVALDLRDARAVRVAAATMLARVAAERPQAAIRGLLLEAMAPAGKELLLGGVHDPQWGPVLMVGLGGIYVEVIGDTTVRLAPVSPGEASSLLDELRIAPLLRGARGERPVDRLVLAGIISRFSQLLVDLPELREIEINPLMASPDGAVAVDTRARLGA